MIRMSEISSKVFLKSFDMKCAPMTLSTTSAMFLPVQFTVSVAATCSLKGGLQDLRSGSIVLMYAFRLRRLPIRRKYRLVMKAIFNWSILFSSASFSYYRQYLYERSVPASFKTVSPYVSRVWYDFLEDCIPAFDVAQSTNSG